MNPKLLSKQNKRRTCLATFLTFILLQSYAGNFVKQNHKSSDDLTSEMYQSMTFNGAWCWFSDPRAVYFEGEHKRTYSGWIDNFGDIHVGYYDHETGEVHSKTLYDNLEIDDHDNPALLFDEEGRLQVYFCTHTIGTKPLYLVRASSPENIDEWEPVQELFLNDKAFRDLGGMNHTYSHPIRLTAENNRIYLFWRGIDGKPSFSFSDDTGKTWAKGQIFFMPERVYKFRRPYTKVYSDGNDRIHITVTDGHPRKETENSIYYTCLKNGAFYKADGTMIKTIEELPMLPSDLDMVYDAKEGGAKAWNWDIAATAAGDPVIAYAKFPNDSNHVYCYAKWEKGKWNNYDLINAGGWFPKTKEGQEEPEPNYSGGMSIDHENPETVYLSVKRDSVFEIEQWTTKNSGKAWHVKAITKGSSKDNIRPTTVRGAKSDNPNQVLWMQNTRYIHFAYGRRFIGQMGGTFDERYLTSIKMDLPSLAMTNPLDTAAIEHVMRLSADWQLSNPLTEKHARSSPLNWLYGAFYVGLRSFYELTGEQRYKDEMINVGQSNDWQPMDEIFNADRLAIIDNWAWLYGMEKDAKMIDKSQWALDIHLARGTKKTDVRFKDNPYFGEWWSWCDALFMAPPSFVQMWKATDNTDYLTYMNTQWWQTSDYLYSTSDSLFFRDDRYFERRTANDKKIFWSRGNGWVIAGLARILTDLPADYPTRPKFEQQYQEMAHKLLSLQSEDGLWRVSLLDPEFLDLGESSGSAFFTYALAWGINNGLIDQEYRPNVEKAWSALYGHVNAEGRLGYVQQVAGDPYPFQPDQWQVYATGAFLMAGKEMHCLEKTH